MNNTRAAQLTAEINTVLSRGQCYKTFFLAAYEWAKKWRHDTQHNDTRHSVFLC